MSETKPRKTPLSRKPGPLLRVHRQTVESSQKMSPAVLLGSSLALAMGLFAWGGMALDERFGTEPLGVVCGLLLEILFGVYEVWKVIRMTGASDAEQDTDTEENR